MRLEQQNLYRIILIWIYIAISLIIISCASPSQKKAETLFKTQCASCHLLPSIQDLPKEIWKKGVLPDMAARMGILDSLNDPYKGLSFTEQNAVMQTGIYPNQPRITIEDWILLRDYIISTAPNSLPSNNINTAKELWQFNPKPINLDDKNGTFISFLQFNNKNNTIITADLNGTILTYSAITNEKNALKKTKDVITDYTLLDSITYITQVGYLNPSEVSKGTILIDHNDSIKEIPIPLHRPVNTIVNDLNENGKNELVVSEFGNLTGQLSLLYQSKNNNYEKKVLLNQPGCIRTIVKDMNGDGKKDLITLTSQGREGITILYQKDNLEFVAESVIKFSPVYGSSWFELIDYDGDGDDDIITVNGDNADKSFVHKPYHGLRIHINNGANKFEEKYFFALNGATRVVAHDFDQDGDIDFGVVAIFPDYEKKPEFSFVYLENENSDKFQFGSYTFKDSKLGNWFLMDFGDVDKDGDQDIILSSFTYGFNKIPDSLMTYWFKSNTDLMILENKIIQ